MAQPGKGHVHFFANRLFRRFRREFPDAQSEESVHRSGSANLGTKTEVQFGVTASQTYDYDYTHQLTWVGPRQYHYDDNGNRT